MGRFSECARSLAVAVVVALACIAPARAETPKPPTGDCLLVVDDYTYISGRCHGSDTGDQLILSNDRYGVVVQFRKGDVAHGFWTGPFGDDRAQQFLGEVVRDGDCWINKRVKVCLFGRLHAMLGTCSIVVKGRSYVSGQCPIEIYNPSGAVYINDRCDAKPAYSASIVPEQPGSGYGSWSGDPPTADADVPLGTLKRTGACWTNEVSRLCAVKGPPRTPDQCKAGTRPIPNGYDDAELRADFYEPDGRCSFSADGRTYIPDACSVETQGNGLIVTGAGKAAGYAVTLTASKKGVTGAWNGAFGERGFNRSLGELTQQADCWENDRAKLCVHFPTPTLDCRDPASCRWRLPAR